MIGSISNFATLTRRFLHLSVELEEDTGLAGDDKILFLFSSTGLDEDRDSDLQSDFKDMLEVERSKGCENSGKSSFSGSQSNLAS
jgi:hypothetical protein